MLLLSDGTIGRFWPEPQHMDTSSSWHRTVEYVSTLAPDTNSDSMSSFMTGHGTLVENVKRRLAEAIVAYERAGIRRSDYD